MKKITLTLLSLLSAPLLAAPGPGGQPAGGAGGATDGRSAVWHDLSDPRAVYSSAIVSAGKDGVNLSASYGGYLNGLYKQKITVATMHDLDYYQVDYLLVNANTNSGFSLETSWDRDNWDIKNVNDSAIGVFAKVPLYEGMLNIYPKLDLGLLWGDDVKSTTYIQVEIPARYKVTDFFWVGATPTYTYAMQGYNLNEWDGSFDAGVQLSPEFSFAAHANTNDEYWVDVIFTF